jgi:hypothetical protein
LIIQIHYLYTNNNTLCHKAFAIQHRLVSIDFKPVLNSIIFINKQYTMKQIHLLLITLCLLAASSCHKNRNTNRSLNCLDGNNQCILDSQFVNTNTTTTTETCIQWDGVNVKNVTAPQMAKIGDSIAIKLNAIAINNGANGNVLFATAQDDDIVEIKTFLQYNICLSSAQVLNNVAATYYFVPKSSGEHHFTFINVYGDRTRLNIQIKK